MELVDRFLSLRRSLDWSQARLARELGVSQPTVWRIEHGKQEASKPVLKLLEQIEKSASEMAHD